MDNFVEKKQLIDKLKKCSEKFNYKELCKELDSNNFLITFAYYYFKYIGYDIYVEYEETLQTQYNHCLHQLSNIMMGQGLSAKYYTFVSKDIIRNKQIDRLILRINGTTYGYIEVTQKWLGVTKLYVYRPVNSNNFQIEKEQIKNVGARTIGFKRIYDSCFKTFLQYPLKVHFKKHIEPVGLLKLEKKFIKYMTRDSLLGHCVYYVVNNKSKYERECSIGLNNDIRKLIYEYT